MFELLGNVVNESALSPEEDAFMENYSTGWECNYNDAEDALLFTAMESEQNFNAIMQATMIQEASYFMEHGTEMVYEAVDFNAFFGKIKDFVLKTWEKIKAIFKKVFDTIAGWVASDKKYIEKNGEAMKKANDTPIEYKGYPVRVNEVDLIGDITNLVKTYDVKNVLDKDFKAEEIPKDIIGAIAGGSSSTKEDYVKYAQKKLGIDNKVTITKYDGDACIETIKTAKGARKIAKAQYNAAKKLFGLMAAQCDTGAKTLAALTDDKEESKRLNKASGAFSKAMNQCSSLAHVALQQTIKAINIDYRQAKAMTVIALAEYKKANNIKSESALTFDGVELI